MKYVLNEEFAELMKNLMYYSKMSFNECMEFLRNREIKNGNKKL